MFEVDERSLSVEGVRSTGSCHTAYNGTQSEGSCSRCEIVTERSEAESADLIIFKDHFFSLPSHVRPSSQLWMVYMLGQSQLSSLTLPHCLHRMSSAHLSSPSQQPHLQLDRHLQAGQHHRHAVRVLAVLREGPGQPAPGHQLRCQQDTVGG